MARAGSMCSSLLLLLLPLHRSPVTSCVRVSYCCFFSCWMLISSIGVVRSLQERRPHFVRCWLDEQGVDVRGGETATCGSEEGLA